MKKNVFMIMVLCCVSMMANAEVAKYCMSYADYVADNWKSVDELTEGCTNQVCQLKSDDHCVYFKTGDKACDEILKKQAFAVKYGNQLYVNSRNLRYNDIPLETSKYIQAVPYGDHKLCVMAYKTNTLLALADIDKKKTQAGIDGDTKAVEELEKRYQELKKQIADAAAGATHL